MQLPYLLIAGQYYYPSSGCGDWIGCFETREKAMDRVILKPLGDFYECEIEGRDCGWFKIVDLRDWTEKK